MHRAALVAHRNLDVGARVDDGERLRAGLDATGADALEPRSHIVGRDEVDHAGGVDEACRPGALRASPGENDEPGQNKEAHMRRGSHRAFHLELLQAAIKSGRTPTGAKHW
jgi:hypothetical protein